MADANKTLATKQYVDDMAGSAITVDQTYNAESTNPQSGTAVAEAVSNKVDKETGKGLSSNDYTNEEKEKLAGIEAGAQVNATVDTTYSPESQNAQSGIAVAQAVDTCSPAIITTSDTAKTLSISDSAEGNIKGLTAYGESAQDGTPTPDSPVEIVSVENPVISVYGKNLIPYPYEETTKTINGITFTDNGDGTITANGTATGAAAFNLQVTVPIAVKNQKVALSGCPVGGSTSSYFILLSYGGNSWPETGSGLAAAPTAPVTIQLRVASGATVNNITFKPQLELGSVATAYEPNSRLQTVTIPYTFAEGDTLILEDGAVKVNISGQETDITATEAGQELLALKTNYPTTSVISDIDLNLTYRADTKNYIDNKFAALTALTLEG